MLRTMQHRLALLLALSASVLTTAACGKKTDKTGAAAGSSATATGGTPAAGAPATPPKAAAAVGDKKLPGLGITAQLPADATVDEQKMDAGGIQATISYGEMSNFFIENVGDMSDSYDATLKHAEAKEFKVQEKAADNTTWKLHYLFADMMEPTKMVNGVAVRTKIGDKLYDCGSRGLTDAQAAELLKICTTLK